MREQLSLFASDIPERPLPHFSDYIVYVDESGDHSMMQVDAAYPVFVLAFCVFHKRHYAQAVIPALEEFKFRHFGHDAVVLHEHDIRKQKPPFAFLTHQPRRQAFMDELSDIMHASNFVLLACLIDKQKLRKESTQAHNPYHLALAQCLDGLHAFLKEKDQLARPTHVLLECRGKKEDKALELEFRRICDAREAQGLTYPFEAVFTDKKSNQAGLQLADLVARPIGMRYLRPEQENRAFEILRNKFLCRGGRDDVGHDYEGYGLVVLPPKSEKPR